MWPPTLAVRFLFAFALGMSGGTGVANSQNASCQSGLPTAAGCGANPNPATIPLGVGGNQISRANCGSTLAYAVASLYSYDDPTCRTAGDALVAGTHHFKFVNNAPYYLTPNWRRITQTFHSKGALYCDTDSNTLILAFAGSLPPSLDTNAID